MIDLDELEREREEATIDKVDLFDFYNKNWDRLIEEIRELRTQIESNRTEECPECGSDGTNGNPTFTCLTCGRKGTSDEEE